MWTDCLGNAVTLESQGSLGALNDFVEGFIASEARAVNVVTAAAQDMSPIVKACAAAVHMFAESRAAPDNARPFIARAVALVGQCTDRERRFIRAVQAWVD